jgi:AcrR family transcriptional regulator
MTESTTATQPAPRRVDAERNRDRILAAAREAFSEPEADISMAEIGRRAGVGSATLYRNFANRRELLEALYAAEIDAVCEAAAIVDGDTPRARLITWLRRFYLYFTSKRPVAAELLKHADRANPLFTGGRPRVVAAGTPLLRAAQGDGSVRADLTLDQVLDMIVAIATIPGDADYREPILEAALDALRPATAD